MKNSTSETLILKTMTNTGDEFQVDNNTPTLISFTLCPFVQRSVITFNAKKIPFARVYIDLKNPPLWFTDVVPTGKVPALFVDGEVLFESAVINEFIDENYSSRLQDKSHLSRAKERAWISYVDEMMIDQYKLLMSQNNESFEVEKEKLFSKLDVLGKISGDKYFADNSFGLMDAAIAPLFMRLLLSSDLYQELQLTAGKNSRLISWIENLTALPIVKDSVVDDFNSQFLEYFGKLGSYIINTNTATAVA